MANQQRNDEDAPPIALATVPASQPFELSVLDIVHRKTKIQEVMQKVMREGKDGQGHYGTVTGCGDKKVLFKAGAETLATTFSLAPRFKIGKTELPNQHREYEIITQMVHIPTGQVVGEGVGCASTMETKYRFRKGGGPPCPDCGEMLRRSREREEWYCWAKQGGCGAKFPLDQVPGGTGQTENPNISDTYNTVLKIAKKRSLIDAILTCTGASDIFTQDLDDLAEAAEEIEDRAGEAPPKDSPETRPQPDPEKAARGEKILILTKLRRDDPEAFLAGRRVSIPEGADPAREAAKVDIPAMALKELNETIDVALKWQEKNPPLPAGWTGGGKPDPTRQQKR